MVDSCARILKVKGSINQRPTRIMADSPATFRRENNTNVYIPVGLPASPSPPTQRLPGC